jgi:hypothetical protein
MKLGKYLTLTPVLASSMPMRTRVQLFITATLVVMSPGVAAAVSPNLAEIAESRRWAAAKFEGIEEKKERDKNQY